MAIAMEIILFAMIILMIITRKENIPEKLNSNKLLKPFYRMGLFTYRKTFGKEGNFYYQKIFDKNSLIYAAKENRQITTEYFVEKLGLCFAAFFVGTIFVIIMSFKAEGETLIKDNNKIKREDYLGRTREITLDADVGDNSIKGIEIDIQNIQYTRDEFYGLMDDYCNELEKEFLGENSSQDMVNKKLNLADEIEGYPFIVEWKLENKDYVDRDGNIKDGVPEEGVLLNIKAYISYQEWEAEHEFFVKIYPYEMTPEEMLTKNIEQLIADFQNKTASEEYLTLPEEISGMKIVWKEKKTMNTVIFAVIVIAVVVGIFIGKDMDLDKKIQLRNSQMMDDYAEIISKLTLLVGAGMSVVMAWKKIAKDYQKKKQTGYPVHFAYEEMTYTMYEMESGVTENRCYQHFADRVKMQKYVKLISLLEQNIKMGTSGLIEDLKRESIDAFNEKKNLAEKKGEESATKLLLPMFMQLLIVMVVIMVPAFMSM